LIDFGLSEIVKKIVFLLYFKDKKFVEKLIEKEKELSK